VNSKILPRFRAGFFKTRWAITYNIHVTTVAMEKQQILNIMSVCILALFIHHAMCLCHVILSPVVCLSVLYFSHYLINGMISGKSLMNIKCMF
jgi:hypothetical protein